MKKIFFLPFLFLLVHAKSQLLKKYAVAQTGCAIYMFCDPGKFNLDYSEDSSKVYTATCSKEGFTYGVICAQLKDSLTAEDDTTGLLESYLDHLKSAFDVREATGYGKGMHLQNREEITGIIDYWQTTNKIHYAIQGWTDGKIVAVLYVSGESQPDFNKQQLFFKGFRFPGMP